MRVASNAGSPIRFTMRTRPFATGAIVYYSNSGCTDLYALLPAPPAGCGPAFPKYVFTATESGAGNACGAVYLDHPAPPKYVYSIDDPPYCGAPSGQTAIHLYRWAT